MILIYIRCLLHFSIKMFLITTLDFPAILDRQFCSFLRISQSSSVRDMMQEFVSSTDLIAVLSVWLYAVSLLCV
jgi:hypothetical protein